MYKFQNFYEMIKGAALTHPKKVAIIEEKERIVFSKLVANIDHIANFLSNSGIKKGDKVALIVPNSSSFVTIFLAISKVGAVAVPINTFLKNEEFAYILGDCGAKLLFCGTQYEEQTKELLDLPSLQNIVWVGESGYDLSLDKIYQNSYEEVLHVEVGLEDIATIIYTSGTTGQPKGAMLSYKNMFSNIRAGEEVFGINKNDRFIVYLPMFHSFTLTIMVLLPFFTASSIVIVGSIFPFSNVLKQTLVHRVTIFLGVPTVYNALLKAKIPWYFMWFNKIRIFISGSAPLSEQAIKEFSKKFKNASLLEGYGLSECSPAVAVNRQGAQKALSVGVALPTYQVKIVDEDMIEVPLGSVGEIIIKGDCVMKGYYNRHDATDETIVNGWLKSGDLGKMDKDGYIYIVDRKKDLIISKGINIYPREIEELLYKFEGVELCAVVGIKDSTNDEEVIAFVQTKEDVIDLSEKELKSYLKTHLANFKVPKHIYFVEELPKNAAGKVLKRVLKEHINSGKFVNK